MIFYGASHGNCRRLFPGTHRLDIALAVFILVGSAAHSLAQLPKSAVPPPAKTEQTIAVDPFGRDTPRSAMMGFLKRTELEDYETAARYLQPTPGQKTNLALRAKELQALFRRGLKANLSLLSDDANGMTEPGLPPGQIRAGVLEAGSMIADVVLVRVDDPASGKIWLISKETVARIPALYAQMQEEAPTVADRVMPATLTGRHLLGMSLAQWLGWLLSIPISWFLAWLLAFFLSASARIRYRLHKLSLRPVWDTRLGMPLKCIIAILIHSLFVYLLELPLLYRVYYLRFMATLFVGCCVWLVSTITDRGFEHAVNRSRTQHKGGESILIVMQRLTRILMLIIAIVAALALFGFNVKTTLAGLGIGGLAIALAAQKTLENLIGGVSLLMDKAVHIGDSCRIGDQSGTVEDIGLRSLKLRTPNQTLLVVPNGALAQMQFENMTCRSKLLINQHFSLRIETRAEQLRFVLERVQSMLDQHAGIEQRTSRVCVTSFVGAAFELELFAYVTTGDWVQFTSIRQDVILKIADIVEDSGARFAAPTQLTYLSRDRGVDAEKANDVVRRVTELRANDVFLSPDEARTGSE